MNLATVVKALLAAAAVVYVKRVVQRKKDRKPGAKLRAYEDKQRGL
jgi:membrane protein implicated in regulation of membrane protease activity